MFPRGRDALIAIACGVQDPGNVGAIVRVAEAAGATGVIAAEHAADPFGWKALRGSMGSALRLPIAIETDAHAVIASLKSHRCMVAAAVPRGGALMYDAPLRGPVALLVGSEGAGLSCDLLAQADARITIPMAPGVESLNTAVSAAVLLYEAARQRR
jgi:TrmH family RNA methyltransferase